MTVLESACHEEFRTPPLHALFDEVLAELFKMSSALNISVNAA